MNTLPQAITATFFSTPDDYARLRARWSELQRSDRRTTLSAAHHLLYLALLGKDWRRGFSPIRNQRKLANGALYGWGLYRALQALRGTARDEWLLEPFAGLVTPDALARLRTVLPTLRALVNEPAAFQEGRFPLEAYVLTGGTAC